MQCLASDPRGPGSSLGVLCLFICWVSFHWLEGPSGLLITKKISQRHSFLWMEENFCKRTPGPLEAEEVPTRLACLTVMWLGGPGAGLGGLWPVRVLGNLDGDTK